MDKRLKVLGVTAVAVGIGVGLAYGAVRWKQYESELAVQTAVETKRALDTYQLDRRADCTIAHDEAEYKLMEECAERTGRTEGDCLAWIYATDSKFPLPCQ